MRSNRRGGCNRGAINRGSFTRERGRKESKFQHRKGSNFSITKGDISKKEILHQQEEISATKGSKIATINNQIRRLFSSCFACSFEIELENKFFLLCNDFIINES